MSRVDDSDNQRIKEMQEQELRTRMDRDKKNQEVRVTKSFQQVMSERGQKQTTQKQTSDKQGQTEGMQREREQQVLKNLLAKTPKEAPELNRRAAMSNALHQNLVKRRADDGQTMKRAENERNEELIQKTDDDKERIDKELRAEDEGDLKRAEERDAAFRKIDPDQEGKNHQRADERDRRRGGDGQGEDGEKRPQGIQAAEAKQAQGPREPRIPPEVIDKVVNAIYAAHHADGRTEMHIDLKGTMLEGVRLEVRAQDGKVHCTFKNCTKEMKALLETSKGALMRGLGKKGLNLASMKVM